MKVLLDIREDKVDFVMELISNLKFVKAKPLDEDKAKLIEEVKTAVEEVRKDKKGDIELQEAKDFLNEL